MNPSLEALKKSASEWTRQNHDITRWPVSVEALLARAFAIVCEDQARIANSGKLLYQVGFKDGIAKCVEKVDELVLYWNNHLITESSVREDIAKAARSLLKEEK
mgnify:FL=1